MYNKIDETLNFIDIPQFQNTIKFTINLVSLNELLLQTADFRLILSYELALLSQVWYYNNRHVK